MSRPYPRELALLFVAAFLLLVPGVMWDLPSGKSVAGALVILEGGVPYRDFWSMYAPGQFYATAALYGLFGRELLVQAVATCLVRAASAVIFVVLLQRLGVTRTQSFAVAAVFVLMFWKTAPELTDYPLALPFLLLSLDRAVRYFAEARASHLRWAGVWLGLGACFKHDISAYIGLGLSISLLASWSMLRGRRPAGWLPPLRATLTVASAAVAVVAPVAIWTAWTAGPAAWNDLVVFPATVFSRVRGEPFPPLLPDVGPVLAWLADPGHARKALRAADDLGRWITLYVPAAVFLAGSGVLLVARRQLQPGALASLVFFMACSPFFWTAAHVQQNTHPYTLAILAACAGIVIWSRWADGPRSRDRWRGPLMAGLFAYACGLITPAAVDAAAVYYEWRGSQVLEISGLRGIRLPARLYSAYEPLGRFFRTYVPEGEAIYTGLRRHDSIVINNSLLYAIAGRPACCGFTELHPGVADRWSVQEGIIDRLEAGNVRVIALWRFGWADQIMDARKRRTMAGVPDAGATILDRYIADRFVVVARYGEYDILWRRDAPRPAELTPLLGEME